VLSNFRSQMGMKSFKSDYLEQMSSSIAEGLLIGVGAGVVSSILLGFYHLGRKHWMRREQVRYLRRCIIDSLTKIENSGNIAKDIPKAAPGDLRQAFFKDFMRHMKAAVNYRTTALTDNQIFDLRKAMDTQEDFVDFVKSGIERLAREEGVTLADGTVLPQDFYFYRSVYRQFAEIKWLKLPEDIDSNPNTST